MRFRVLGPLEVSGENGPVVLGGPKQRAVLANLIVRANQLVPADTLIDLVWGDEPPESARNVLQTYVSHLRKALGPGRLEGRAPGYILHVDPDELDARRFEDLLREARSFDGQADRASPLLIEALDLWRGPAFADLSTEGSLQGEIARLEDLRMQGLEERIDADIKRGLHLEVVGELQTRTRETPLRERLWGLLILALYRSGRQADALAAYQRLRQLLAEELGVDPSPDLRTLHGGSCVRIPTSTQGASRCAATGCSSRSARARSAWSIARRSRRSGARSRSRLFIPSWRTTPTSSAASSKAQIVARLEHPHIVPL